jgi:hypothetical protein
LRAFRFFRRPAVRAVVSLYLVTICASALLIIGAASLTYS